MIKFDISSLVKDLDASDLFLRNRAKCTPSPLNDYDIMLMEDAASVCDRAARMLENSYIVPYKVGDTLYFITTYTKEVEADTIKYITITKNGIKPILNHHNIRFWDYHEFGRDVFWTEAEALEAKKKLEVEE